MSSNIFYVYIIFDPRNKGKFLYEDLDFEYEPFYVGKGSGKRIKKLSNIFKIIPTRKIKSIKY